jgi:hypothetical protein
MAPFDHTGTLIVMANPDSHELVCASSTAASHRCGAIFAGTRSLHPRFLYPVPLGIHSTDKKTPGEPGHTRDGHTDLSPSNLVLCDVGSGKK